MAKNKINEWTNGINGLQVRAIIKETFEYLENLVTSLTNLSFQKYESYEDLEQDLANNKLNTSTIYIVPEIAEDGSVTNVYNQYIVSNNELLELGNTEIDLTEIENSIVDLQKTVGNFRDNNFNLWSVIGDPTLDENQWITAYDNILYAINFVHETARNALTWIGQHSNLEEVPNQIININNNIQDIESNIQTLNNMITEINNAISMTNLLIEEVNDIALENTDRLDTIKTLPFNDNNEIIGILTSIPEESREIYNIVGSTDWYIDFTYWNFGVDGDISTIKKDSVIFIKENKFVLLNNLSRRTDMEFDGTTSEFVLNFNTDLYPRPTENLDIDYNEDAVYIVSPKYKWDTNIYSKINNSVQGINISNKEEAFLKSEPYAELEIGVYTANGSNEVTITINDTAKPRLYLPKGAIFKDSTGLEYKLKENISMTDSFWTTKTTVDLIENMGITSSLNHYATILYLPENYSWDSETYKFLDLINLKSSDVIASYGNTLSLILAQIIMDISSMPEIIENVNKIIIQEFQNPYNIQLLPNYKYIITEDNFIFDNIIDINNNPMTPNQYIYISFNTLNSYPKFNSAFFEGLLGWAGEDPVLGEDGYYTFKDGYHYEICINNEGYAVCAKFNPAPKVAAVEANE